MSRQCCISSMPSIERGVRRSRGADRARVYLLSRVLWPLKAQVTAYAEPLAGWVAACGRRCCPAVPRLPAKIPVALSERGRAFRARRLQRPLAVCSADPTTRGQERQCDEAAINQRGPPGCMPHRSIAGRGYARLRQSCGCLATAGVRPMHCGGVVGAGVLTCREHRHSRTNMGGSTCAHPWVRQTHPSPAAGQGDPGVPGGEWGVGVGSSPAKKQRLKGSASTPWSAQVAPTCVKE
jgi:hypothetical protein